MDREAYQGVQIVGDLRDRLPFEDGTIDHILLDNVLEHMRYPFNVQLINEIDRVLKVGGTCTIIVPRFPSPGSVQDAGHVSFYTERSALYWNSRPMPVGTPYSRQAGFTSELVAQRIQRYGNPDEEEYILFEVIRREPPTK